jgi:hypothetical protein
MARGSLTDIPGFSFIRYIPIMQILGTFWLKIEQFWPFEEISIFSNSGHLGYRTVLTDKNLKGTHPGTNQTLMEWSMDGPLPKLCPVILISNQDGHQAKNRKKGG